jgi:gluconokinase
MIRRDADGQRNYGGRMIIVLMGVSGSGKTTVGKILAAQLGWRFVEADDYHPPANIEKLRRGDPLTDSDRRPWLEQLRRVIDGACEGGRDLVVACSALKHAYQEYLEHDASRCVHYVYLHGSEELIRQRMAERKGHFMNPKLLHSQFETLEPPEHAVRVEVSASPESIAAEIRKQLGV